MLQDVLLDYYTASRYFDVKAQEQAVSLPVQLLLTSGSSSLPSSTQAVHTLTSHQRRMLRIPVSTLLYLLLPPPPQHH